MSVYASLVDEALDEWSWARQQLVLEANNIPVERYDFRPAPGARSVTEVIQHIVELALLMTGELCDPEGSFRRAPYDELVQQHAAHVSRARTKDALTELLAAQFEQSSAKFLQAGDLRLLQFITRFDGSPGTRLSWLYHGIGHETYHTGQLTAYQRAMGLVPGLTRAMQAQGA